MPPTSPVVTTPTTSPTLPDAGNKVCGFSGAYFVRCGQAPCGFCVGRGSSALGGTNRPMKYACFWSVSVVLRSGFSIGRRRAPRLRRSEGVQSRPREIGDQKTTHIADFSAILTGRMVPPSEYEVRWRQRETQDQSWARSTLWGGASLLQDGRWPMGNRLLRASVRGLVGQWTRAVRYALTKPS